MTNPLHKKTHEQFLAEVPVELEITITGQYVNTDTKIEYQCKHGNNTSRPWQILKFKHCCRKGYYDSGKMWESNINTLDDIRNRAMSQRENIDISETYFLKDRYKKLCNIKCTIHNTYYDALLGSKIGMCPTCNTERNIRQILAAGPLAWASNSTGSFVSKEETKWLDKLGISGRQVWLKDVKYKVDGYDLLTNTVYLYHGKFWHGCPTTYDPEMIHPIVKIPMKELYEKTLYYEKRIKDAGYNLVTIWG